MILKLNLDYAGDICGSTQNSTTAYANENKHYCSLTDQRNHLYNQLNVYLIYSFSYLLIL